MNSKTPIEKILHVMIAMRTTQTSKYLLYQLSQATWDEHKDASQESQAEFVPYREIVT